MQRALHYVLVAAVAGGCAARGPSPQLVAEMVNADRLVRDGCYRCLEQAAAISARVAALPRAPIAARQAAFDATLLLAVRSKELGLDPGAAMARARQLARELPIEPAALPPSAYVDAVDAIQGELSGLDPEEREDRMRRRRAAAARRGSILPVRSTLQPAVPSSLVAEYLALALDCQDSAAPKEIDAQGVRDRRTDTPLIRYLLATCLGSTSELASLRESDPRWVDTLFFEGRGQMVERPVADVLKASEHFAAARAAFPESNAITLALAYAQNALSDHEAALTNYDAVLVKEGTHRDALLGRLTSLSYLSRHSEAVASATRLIELGTWHIGDAYYWRAWNRYHLHELDLAWSDIEHARTLLVNTSVYTLAGFIARARTWPVTAVERLDRAFEMDKANCDAIWTAGLVHMDEEQWAAAAPKLSRAMTCFHEAAGLAEAEVSQIENASYADTLKIQRIAAARKRIDTSRHRAAQAAFNAASVYVRLGDRASALAHVEDAAKHESMKEKAKTLRTAIEKLPHR